MKQLIVATKDGYLSCHNGGEFIMHHDNTKLGYIVRLTATRRLTYLHHVTLYEYENMRFQLFLKRNA